MAIQSSTHGATAVSDGSPQLILPQESLDTEAFKLKFDTLAPIRRYLQGSPKLIQNNKLDLSLVKKAAEILPTHLPVIAGAENILTDLDAIVFHVGFPLKALLTDRWFDEHSYITDKEDAIDLLRSIGMLPKTSEPFKRRI